MGSVHTAARSRFGVHAGRVRMPLRASTLIAAGLPVRFDRVHLDGRPVDVSPGSRPVTFAAAGTDPAP